MRSLEEIASDYEKKVKPGSDPEKVKKNANMIRNLFNGIGGGSNYTPPKKKRKKR